MEIILRGDKGEELTWEELDGNFQALMALIGASTTEVTEHAFTISDERGVIEGEAAYAIGNIQMDILNPDLTVNYSLHTDSTFLNRYVWIKNIPSDINYRITITNYKGSGTEGTEDIYQVIQKPYTIGNSLSMLFSDTEKRPETYPLTTELTTSLEELPSGALLEFQFDDRFIFPEMPPEGAFDAWIEIYDNETDMNYAPAQSMTINGEDIEVDEYGGLDLYQFAPYIEYNIVVIWEDTTTHNYSVTPTEEFGTLMLYKDGAQGIW